MKEIEYSVLSYSPSIITGERINVGLLFHKSDDDVCRFEYTRKWNRLLAFDDEIDIEFFKLYLEGIKQQVEPDIFQRKKNWRFFIENFANEFRFSSIVKIYPEESFDSFVENTKRVYLRYDYEKKDRATDQDQKALLKRIIKSKGIESAQAKVGGSYGDDISFDFLLPNNDRSTVIKTFTFDNKEISRMIFTVRAWAQIADELKEKFRIVYFYDIDDYSNAELSTAINILRSSNAEVKSFAHAHDVIDKISGSYAYN